MRRVLVMTVMLGSLVGCGTQTSGQSSPATPTQTSARPTTATPQPTPSKPPAKPSPTAFTTATPGCKNFDVDYATKMEDGTWTGGIMSWCAVLGKSLTQADIAQQTVDSERQAGVFVECDLIAPDSSNPQFTAWANDLNASGRPVLHNLIAAIGNC